VTQDEEIYINSELCVILMALEDGTDEDIEEAVQAIAAFTHKEEGVQSVFHG
jgi:hypothetical protein